MEYRRHLSELLLLNWIANACAFRMTESQPEDHNATTQAAVAPAAPTDACGADVARLVRRSSDGTGAARGACTRCGTRARAPNPRSTPRAARAPATRAPTRSAHRGQVWCSCSRCRSLGGLVPRAERALSAWRSPRSFAFIAAAARRLASSGSPPPPSPPPSPPPPCCGPRRLPATDQSRTTASASPAASATSGRQSATCISLNLHIDIREARRGTCNASLAQS